MKQEEEVDDEGEETEEKNNGYFSEKEVQTIESHLMLEASFFNDK